MSNNRHSNTITISDAPLSLPFELKCLACEAHHAP